MAEKSLVNDDGDRAPAVPVPVIDAPPLVVELVAPAVPVVADVADVDDELFELSLPQAARPAAARTTTDTMHARPIQGFLLITSLS